MTEHIYQARPFFDAALVLRGKGLAVIPCPGSNGKSPAGAISNYQSWKRPPSLGFVECMRAKWADANIGAVAHASGVTVIDVDGDERLAQEMMTLCGTTPLITCTPSGGFHLWYRHGGERNANLRNRLGLTVDIKGQAGVVILPPSINRGTGVAYRLLEGSFDDLRRLPGISAGAALKMGLKQEQQNVPVGRRNDALFIAGLSVAGSQSTLEQLSSLMLNMNEALAAPLPEREVAKTAASVWKIQQEGRNRVGGEQYASILKSQFDALSRSDYPLETCWLLLRLIFAHGSRAPGAPFAISADAMAWTNLLPMAAHKIRRARKVLVDCNVLCQISAGGKGKHDPAMFGFQVGRLHGN